MDATARLIGRYSQQKKGPMLVVIGAMHGNEPAGVEAIKAVLLRLKDEEVKNPDFEFRGSFMGVIGNLDAYQKNVRYIDQDLNRSWSYQVYKDIVKKPKEHLNTEHRQIIEIIEELRQEINRAFPTEMVVLDLHTTSAHGGIFSLTTDDDFSIKMAKELHAPVIKGMLKGISDSSIHFFHGQNLGIPTTAIGFECGQHLDPNAINIGVAAIINCMRTINCVNSKDVENFHDEMLIDFSKELPKVNKIIYKYAIKDRSQFSMIPGFKSFDKVAEGQPLAYDGGELITCPKDARILMPLYQKKGNDGYFLIIEEND